MAVIGAVAACSNSGEKVFTRQNQAASALATMVMEAESQGPAKGAAKVDQIYAAENELHAACAPLREMASRRMTGESVGFDAELIAFASLGRCESETQRVEEFIRLSKNGQADCAEFVADRKIPVEKLFSDRWKLEQAEEAYKLFDTQTTGKGVFLM
jgi:hypothetical protein